MPEHDIETCECQGCGGDVPVLDAILLPEFPNRPNPDAKQYCCVARYEFSEKQKLSTLARYAKAITKLVEAGGPETKMFQTPGGYRVQHKGCVTRSKHECIAVLEKYVREDVVVWYQDREGRRSRLPTLIGTGRWTWAVGRKGKPDIVGGDECPTEAYIAFLEAIAEVVAGEKGEVG